jgi:hypothetical protein
MIWTTIFLSNTMFYFVFCLLCEIAESTFLPLDLLQLPVRASAALETPPVLPLMPFEALWADPEAATVADEPSPVVRKHSAAMLTRDVRRTIAPWLSEIHPAA